MPPREVEDLCKRLVRERLADSGPLDAVRMELGGNVTTDVLLQRLEARGVLTSYQVARIQKGEWDDLVLGHFKLMYRNAAGSFARVFRAVDLRNGKMVGLKVLRQRWTKDPSAIKDFVREAQMCLPLQHPNIVPIYEIGKDGDKHFFTMEFVEGGNLRDFVKIRGKLSPKEATKCVLDIAEGLNYALSKGITHRDLKLTNVLMSMSGVAKLVDFGLGGGPTDDSNDAGESLARAVEYATLEKNTGAPRDDPRSDMYFLGVVFYELLTGEPPYARTRDRAERSDWTRYTGVRPVRQVDPTLPMPVCRVVDRLMNLNPLIRYQTPGDAIPDLQAALREVENGVPAQPAPEPPQEGPKPTGPRVPAILFVETRVKQQDMLREYFNKHKFRVLVLQDVQRAINRVSSTPPDAVVLMAESLGEDAIRGFREIQEKDSSVGSVLVLGEKQASWRERVREKPHASVLVQPITLRDLRKTIEKVAPRQGEDDADED